LRAKNSLPPMSSIERKSWGLAVMSREGLLELRFALAPIEFGRNQFVDVGIDGEMSRRIDG